VLSTEQHGRDLAGKLGKSYHKHPDKLSGVNYTLEQNTYPILQDALSWVACEVRSSTPAGDSTLIIAEVIDAGLLAEGEPLTMKAAGFRHAG
jgi:flavin reductase (DIM6/NTAB) family NADH-FMN oxidoreductase RutF